MDVLHVIHQFPPESRGGSESYLLDLAQRQRARGLHVEVLSGSKVWKEEVTLESGEVDGLPVHRLHRDDLFFDHHSKAWHPGVELVFASLLEKWRPKLVHVHHWVRLTCNLIDLCWQKQVPAVATLHDYYTSCPRAFRRREGDEACRRPLSPASCSQCVPKFGYEQAGELDAGVELFRDHYRAELSLARAVIVAVGSTAKLLSETTGVPLDRYEVLPLGYRRRFAGMPALPAPRSDEPLRFAYWGGIGRHKGVDVLLRAFRHVHAARPGRAVLHVLGGVDSEALDRELHDLATGLPVTFHGDFDAGKLHAARPQIGVFPSTCFETYGLVLDECFELGLPCITSDLGALPERAAGAGIATRSGDEQSLAAAMQRFLNEPALWAAKRAAIPPPSPGLDAHVDALMAVYDRARTMPPKEWFAGPVPASRRTWFLMKQRESAMSRLIPPDGPR
ncbi:MAG: glycosyltransferase [Planctomycetes bacterium]|nr:glycosyltransferase [Planctomycetota bacterium]